MGFTVCTIQPSLQSLKAILFLEGQYESFLDPSLLYMETCLLCLGGITLGVVYQNIVSFVLVVVAIHIFSQSLQNPI